jgi:hypothetical protein
VRQGLYIDIACEIIVKTFHFRVLILEWGGFPKGCVCTMAAASSTVCARRPRENGPGNGIRNRWDIRRRYGSIWQGQDAARILRRFGCRNSWGSFVAGIAARRL